jgi:translation initiation factor 5B
VQAPSLGTLEAIIEHLKTLSLDVPVGGCNLGPVHKQDVMNATAIQQQQQQQSLLVPSKLG